jgi:hypothetical protein
MYGMSAGQKMFIQGNDYIWYMGGVPWMCVIWYVCMLYDSHAVQDVI